MDKSNVALVRATNIIPFDGVVRPISEVPYLKKKLNTNFGFEMSDLLRNRGIIQQSSFKISEEEIKNNNKIQEQYMPYMSDYNSMVLWAINGLVPDDSENGFGNNTFSNKKCVIIDGLEEQIQLSNVVSLVPTDAAIRGNVKLSSSAIILIEENEYNSLSDEQKEKLSKFNVKTFTGDLRKTVEKTLLETGRYIPERPILSRAGYEKSETSEELRATINKVAKENNILQMYHLDVVLNSYGNLSGELAEESKNINIVDSYFQRKFFEYICKIMGIDESLSEDLQEYPNNRYYLKLLCKEIEKYGLEEYKKRVSEYNKKLVQMKNDGTLPTPQQIVDAEKKRIHEEQKQYEHELLD